MDGAVIAYPTQVSGTQLVRFMTAGSVDDGKSTLIGRLLLDSRALMRDQVAALDLEGDELDLAALTDGLEAERAQGITIDVAYRYFATRRASFVIADSPGHEQYTRNMVTAASVSDVAVIVIDAARVVNGALKPQTRRHAAVAALMGLDVIVAVNKMDAVGWSHARFEEIRSSFLEAAKALNIGRVAFVPVSAKRGDNVVRAGGADWYSGPTLVRLLEERGSQSNQETKALRLPVQVVLREGERRFYAGRIESGSLHSGDRVRVGASAQHATIARLTIAGASAARADAGASVAVELNEYRDLAPGDVIASDDVRYARRFVADLCWLDQDDWKPGRRYRLRQGALETQGVIERVNFVRDMDDLSETAASALSSNDIARVQVAVRDPILADRYQDLPGTGAFVLFDPDTNQTAAAGMIREILE